MLQRIQTLYLFIAAACAAAMFLMPVYGGSLQDGAVKNFMVSSNILLFLIVIVIAIIPFITIFFFKNRPMQMKLIWLSILLCILAIVLVYVKSTDFGANPAFNFKAASYKVSAALPVLELILLFMAFGGIRKDEKLVRSVDRLR